MKINITVTAMLASAFLSQFSFAQNLVPNPSFEQYDTCPDNQAQIARATGWQIYSGLGSTPDYYNACDTGGLWCVPNGVGVHQYAIDGSAYGAVVTFNSGLLYREYIGTQLLQSLIIGQKYFLSLYTTMGGGHPSSTPSNNIGLLLSTIPYSQNNPTPTNNFAHLFSTTIVSDTVNWIHISGSFIADSVYNYCIIGNFFDNMNTDTIHWNSNSTFSYYAIDQICISNDSVVCNPNIEEKIITYDNKNVFDIYPNPSSGLLYINNELNIPYEIFIYDEFARLVIHEMNVQGKRKINLEKFNSGMYLLQIRDKSQTYSKKIIKR